MCVYLILRACMGECMLVKSWVYVTRFLRVTCYVLRVTCWQVRAQTINERKRNGSGLTGCGNWRRWLSGYFSGNYKRILIALAGLFTAKVLVTRDWILLISLVLSVTFSSLFDTFSGWKYQGSRWTGKWPGIFCDLHKPGNNREFF